MRAVNEKLRIFEVILGLVISVVYDLFLATPVRSFFGTTERIVIGGLRKPGLIKTSVLSTLIFFYFALFVFLDSHEVLFSILVGCLIIILHIILHLIRRLKVTTAKLLYLSLIIISPLYMLSLYPSLITHRASGFYHLFVLISTILFFDYQKEKKRFFTICSLLMLILLIHEIVLFNGSFLSPLFSITVWVSVLSAHINYQNFIKKHLAVKSRLYSSVRKQKQRIEELNDSLNTHLHHKSKILKKSKSQLDNYSIFSSHEIRGPLARILGLNSLLIKNRISDIDEANQIVKMINEEAIELDMKITKLVRMSEKYILMNSDLEENSIPNKNQHG